MGARIMEQVSFKSGAREIGGKEDFVELGKVAANCSDVELGQDGFLRLPVEKESHRRTDAMRVDAPPAE